MANVFNSVKGLHPKRNAFRSDTYRNDFTAPLGVNIPCYLQEVPPATKVKLSASALVRLQALIAPVMDNIDYYVHFWKVPYRLLEDDRFTAFISGEIEGADYDALFCTPYDLADNLVGLHDTTSDQYNAIFGNGSLLDFLGYDVDLFPTLDTEHGTLTGGNNTTVFNWRPLIAYYMLHLNWYMNENVPYFPAFVENVDNLVKEQSLDALCNLLYMTTDLVEDYSLLPHGWDKDYFTSALPNVQAGDPVTLPIVGNAPVHFEDFSNLQISDPSLIYTDTPQQPGYFENVVVKNLSGEAYPGGQLYSDSKDVAYDALQGEFGPKTSGSEAIEAYADLSEASAITINELRFANALQIFKERQLRFGRRRLEYYKGFFDVSPEDLRLQVPKYLGGGRIPINIADIEQTSATSGSSALGSLGGKATAVAGGFAGFSTFCSEESVIIGISFAMPHITYSKSVSRFRLKTNDIYDYFNPSFEHLGEQAIKNIEVYSGASRPDDEFGYTPRYNEYRFHSNEMHGAFKDSLAFWSLGRIFDSQPALNPSFIYMQPSAFDRIFAVSNQPNMVVSMLFNVITIKPVSKYGTPMLLS